MEVGAEVDQEESTQWCEYEHPDLYHRRGREARTSLRGWGWKCHQLPGCVSYQASFLPVLPPVRYLRRV